MKYFKLNGEVWAFPDDGSQDKLISTKHIPLTDDELHRHLNPDLYLSDQERRASMPNLTKRDFRKKLRDANLFEQAESYVRSSGDGYLEDAWDYSDYFARLDPFIIQASEALGLTHEQVDAIWTA